MVTTVRNCVVTVRVLHPVTSSQGCVTLARLAGSCRTVQQVRASFGTFFLYSLGRFSIVKHHMSILSV